MLILNSEACMKFRTTGENIVSQQFYILSFIYILTDPINV